MRRVTTTAAVGLAVMLMTGCALIPGSRSTGSSDAHRLLPSTKALLQPEPWPLPRELNKHPLLPYVVEAGDVLLVQPADIDSPVRIPGDQPVLPDGTINLGRYGLLQVSGRTIPEIEGMVSEAVEAKTKNPGPIVVRVVSRQSKVYYVLGEVNSPGAIQLTGRETVLDGILAGGGLTERASRRHIILSRPTDPASCRLVLPICYLEIVQHGDTTTNYQLAPGDRIYVPRGRFWEDFCDRFFDKGCGCPPSRRCDYPAE